MFTIIYLWFWEKIISFFGMFAIIKLWFWTKIIPLIEMFTIIEQHYWTKILQWCKSMQNCQIPVTDRHLNGIWLDTKIGKGIGRYVIDVWLMRLQGGGRVFEVNQFRNRLDSNVAIVLFDPPIYRLFEACWAIKLMFVSPWIKIAKSGEKLYLPRAAFQFALRTPFVLLRYNLRFVDNLILRQVSDLILWNLS